MSAKHTQGPLVLAQHGAIRGGPMVRYINGSIQEQVAMTTGAGWMVQGEHLANARRLVACWNACESFSTEMLEGAMSAVVQGGFVGMWSNYCDKKSEAEDLRAQRDKLLTALKQRADMDITVHGLAGMQRVANAAIAEFEGRAS